MIHSQPLSVVTAANTFSFVNPGLRSWNVLDLFIWGPNRSVAIGGIFLYSMDAIPPLDCVPSGKRLENTIERSTTFNGSRLTISTGPLSIAIY